jgi:glycosyltransferase involved in cell wall biosynthesis
MKPLVSVVTPVYNEAEFLRECIESVLAQTYENWDYTIVDNRSTDRSAEIAAEYALRDSRIKLVKNQTFVSAIENHNNAFREISPSSTYCKLLSGDDWLYPEFIAKSVEVAERFPNVGVVASYSVNTEFGFRWPGLDIGKTVFDGRDICRWFLLGLIDSFFAPSVVLYRSSLVRAERHFFPGTAASADLSACLNCLGKMDLGFVHQILSFERIHKDSDTAQVRKMNTYLLDRIPILKELAPRYLTPAEYSQRLEEILTEYYEAVLVAGIFAFREKEFWRLHKKRLGQLDYPFYGARLFKGIVKKSLDLALNPKQTLEKVLKRTSKGCTQPKPGTANTLPTPHSLDENHSHI